MCHWPTAESVVAKSKGCCGKIQRVCISWLSLQNCVNQQRLRNSRGRDIGVSLRGPSQAPLFAPEEIRQVAHSYPSSPPVEERARQPGTDPHEAVLDVYLERNQRFARQHEGMRPSLISSGEGSLQAHSES